MKLKELTEHQLDAAHLRWLEARAAGLTVREIAVTEDVNPRSVQAALDRIDDEHGQSEGWW